VGDVASSSFGNKLFLEGKEDEDKDTCERRKAYKKVYQQNYRYR
jgi:hypothetical protein